MPRPQSQPAIEALHQLELPVTHEAALSFAEPAGIRTAAWAVQKFGGAMLIDSVKHDYYSAPMRNSEGEVIELEELGGNFAAGIDDAQMDAADLADALVSDLYGGLKRVQRGYPLETVTVRGVKDTATVVASLERAVELDPINLESADQHYQAAARYMLDHMVSQNDGTSQSFLL